MTGKTSRMPILTNRINSLAACVIAAAALLTAALTLHAVKGARLRLPASVSRLTRLYTHPVTVSAPTGDLAAESAL